MKEYVLIPEERIKLFRKNKKLIEKIEKLTDSKIQVNEEIVIECEDPLLALRIKEVIRAFGRGFDIDTSLNLLDEEYFLETIEIKRYSGKSRKRQVVLKGRVIGREGKMKRMIEKYAKVKVSIYGKTISIIGRWENLRIAKKAIEMLLKGAMHSTVYAFLEKHGAK